MDPEDEDQEPLMGMADRYDGVENYLNEFDFQNEID